MANSWLRLWHDMPNDPKWRTIARVSKQPISSVLAVYVHLLVIASNATERGRTQNACTEDLASALDLDNEQIEAIMSAMQGRVLDGDIVSGFGRCVPTNKDMGVFSSRPKANIWRVIRSRIFERDDYTCKYCGERGKKLECDHVVPVSRGGSHTDDNLVTACFKCNRSKRDKLIHEWGGN